ncbi:DRTGG domain-containing protein [Carboxydothermus hydrogenoformans]|uniref:CBS domain protein n=1 Tax=Carboxydothermus hydrogenoformans (strain ATCC BAA-161 / DSM 6008 / Z-2901) TaxID=246194 RepID=Q3AD02_CARHZ|nr:DRTGG domain-containing protein [Carboxydothermus hydrogenoformans]ABB13913.1 CBS domain protein [Carboxydothermus hydrogenoformans Z-2901]
MSNTKHAKLLAYIRNLPSGSKVSVRLLAKELKVSEGTAYRAIKEAEAEGLVKTVPKVGTIRITNIEKKELKDLTLNEIIKITESHLLVGEDLLNYRFANFLIGAMAVEAIERFLVEGCLFIVGNREDAQLKALQSGAHLLITGGFPVKTELLELARENNLAILSSPYDTFTVTSLLHQALYERLKEKEVITARDIMVKKVFTLSLGQRVRDWRQLFLNTGHSRFPVVDKENRVCGIITATDVAGAGEDELVENLMSKDVISASPETPIGHIARVMTWDRIDLVPVVDESFKLLGIISRQNIIDALQRLERQPHFGETLEDLIIKNFHVGEDENGIFLEGKINDFLINELSMLSSTVLLSLSIFYANLMVRKKVKAPVVVNNFSLSLLTPLTYGETLVVRGKLLYLEKRNAKLEIDFYRQSNLNAKALIEVRLIEK